MSDIRLTENQREQITTVFNTHPQLMKKFKSPSGSVRGFLALLKHNLEEKQKAVDAPDPCIRPLSEDEQEHLKKIAKAAEKLAKLLGEGMTGSKASIEKLPNYLAPIVYARIGEQQLEEPQNVVKAIEYAALTTIELYRATDKKGIDRPQVGLGERFRGTYVQPTPDQMKMLALKRTCNSYLVDVYPTKTNRGLFGLLAEALFDDRKDVRRLIERWA